MKKFFVSLTFAAGVTAIAAIQANGSNSSPPKSAQVKDFRACKVLIKKMERSPSANTWRNRLRTWKCRGNHNSKIATADALRKEL